MTTENELVEFMVRFGIPEISARMIIFNAKKLGKKRSNSRKSAGMVLPIDWEPDQSCYEYALELGYTQESYQSEVRGFKFWAGSNQHRPIGKKSNWFLAFKNWLRNNAKREQSNGNGNYGNRSNEAGMAEALARRRQGRVFIPNDYGKPIIDGTATEILALGNSEFKEFGK